jgi:small-conductance mechanosensitive channel
VLFTNFGENTLDFEVRFWVDVVKANSAMVSSDLRQMIAGTFAENGIIIAYPQRDLHLNSARPLEVRVLPMTEPHPDEPKAAPPPTVAQDGRDKTNSPPHPAAPSRSGPNLV